MLPQTLPSRPSVSANTLLRERLEHFSDWPSSSSLLTSQSHYPAKDSAHQARPWILAICCLEENNLGALSAGLQTDGMARLRLRPHPMWIRERRPPQHPFARGSSHAAHIVMSRLRGVRGEEGRWEEGRHNSTTESLAQGICSATVMN